MTLAQLSSKEIFYTSMGHAVQGVLPQATLQLDFTNQGDETILSEFHVVLGFIGDKKGKIIFNGTKDVFKELGLLLFGMPLSDEMLPSFAGEFGNMIGGNFATSISGNGVVLDITPPTVFEGGAKVFGLKGAQTYSMLLPDGKSLEIILSQEQ